MKMKNSIIFSAVRFSTSKFPRCFSTTSHHFSSQEWLPIDPKFATKAIHSGFKASEDPQGLVVPSISVATTSLQNAPGQPKLFDYIRTGSPSRTALEKTLAALEDGKYGFVFSSGNASVNNALNLLTHGDNVILTDAIYSGTGTLFQGYARKFGITTEFVDIVSNTNALEANLKPNTKMVWLETPTNPKLGIIDIAKTVECVRSYSKDIIVVVDNTFLTPYFQRPLALGADISLHSLTKFGNGHSDVLMGAMITNRDDLMRRIKCVQNDLGAVPSPFDCFLVHRSLKTLHVRMPLHMSNALKVAKFLDSHPKIQSVLHPGLPSHPQHSLALQQSSGHSGLFSFYLKDKSAFALLQRLKVFTLATSLGGPESLASIPCAMSHAGIAPELKAQMGITENFVRLSIGLESPEDLIEDLDQALYQQ